jgi:hypothetical protein
LGLGLTAYAAFQLGHSINSESRQLVDGLPLYVLLAAAAAERVGLGKRHVVLLAALGLVTSKAWLPINRGEWGAPETIPAQLYFMNMGPSMTRTTLLVQAAAAVLALAAAWMALPRPGQRDIACSAGRHESAR